MTWVEKHTDELSNTTNAQKAAYYSVMNGEFIPCWWSGSTSERTPFKR